MFREIILNTTKFTKLPLNNTVLNLVFGENVVSLEGEKWKKERRLLTPLFHFGALKRYSKIFDSLGTEMVEYLISKKGTSISVEDLFKKYTLKGIIQSTFGNAIDPNLISKALDDLQPVTTQYFFLLTLFGPLTQHIPLPSLRKAKASKKLVSETLQKLLEEKKKEKDNNESDMSDIISIMLNAKEPMPEDFMFSEGMVFLSAGADTTSTLLVIY